MYVEKVDIKENKIYDLNPIILNLLLKDNSSNKNIIWATNNYEKKVKVIILTHKYMII